MTRRVLYVYTTDEIHQAVRVLAARLGITTSELVNDAIKLRLSSRGDNVATRRVTKGKKPNVTTHTKRKRCEGQPGKSM